MRLVLVAVACLALALLGMSDMIAGRVTDGGAGLMLAAANAILLTR